MISTATQTAKFRLWVRRLRQTLPAMPIDVETAAVGLLERLWHTAASSSPRGDIGKLEDELIAEMVGWNQDATQLIDLLVESGWLDRDDDHRLVVHDWHQHAPNYVKGIAARQGGFVTVTDAIPDGDDNPQSITQGAAPELPTQGSQPPNQTNPTQTNPNQPQPTTTNPNGALPEASSVVGRSLVDFEIPNISFVASVADAIYDEFTGMDRNLIWRIAWFGTIFGPGCVEGLKSQLRRKVDGRTKVGDRFSWFEGVIRNKSKELNLDLPKLLRSIPPTPKPKPEPAMV